MENWKRLCDFPSASTSLYMVTSPLRSSFFEPSSLFGRNWNPRVMKRQGLVVFAGGTPRDSRPAFGSDGPLPVGVMFFPSFPFMGVMLFPSPVLGNASGESGVLLVPLSPFSPLLPSLLPLSLLSSHFPSPFPLVRTRSSSLSLSLSPS